MDDFATMLLSNQISPHPRMNVPETVGQRIMDQEENSCEDQTDPFVAWRNTRVFGGQLQCTSALQIFGTPPAVALASIGLANLTNPTKAVVPSDELIESYLKAYLSAIPRGQRTSSDRFLLLSPSRTPSLIKAFGHQHFCALSTSFCSP